MKGLNTVTTFYGVDGARHEVGFVQAQRGGGILLVDLWSGHGPRLLALLSTDGIAAEASRRDGSSFFSSIEAQADAVIREYRVDAATSDRPLSRAVAPEEIAQSAVLVG